MTDFSHDALPMTGDGRSALDVALEATTTAGEIIRGGWDSDRQITFKGRADIVTDIDVAAEKAVLEILTSAFPQFGILAEESQPVAGASPYRWVVDPLDGTRNYAQSIPHFCTIVALAEEDDIVAGVVYDPVREETFTAAKGQGAFLNGAPINVSETTEIARSLLSFDLGYVDEKAGLAIDMLRSLWPGMYSVRMMGSAGLGLAYAASGRVDLFFHHSLSPWDVAAGLVLAQEAGGRVVDRQGNKAGLFTPSVICSSPALVEGFLAATDGLPWRTAS
ncbi:MAG: inositol monophosphatase [Chloroflexi bacterium]|nr:inositol monophosphatase [Chloroflexota bacterium]MYE39362.1 inositol monophosphatase [Chloroflexota bacterium]